MIDFTKQMKKEYTIICPDIFPIHMGLIEDIFVSRGYNLKVVRYGGTSGNRTRVLSTCTTTCVIPRYARSDNFCTH